MRAHKEDPGCWWAASSQLISQYPAVACQGHQLVVMGSSGRVAGKTEVIRKVAKERDE